MNTFNPAAFDLIDSLSQVEANRRSGVLTLDGPWGVAQLYFTSGRLSMLAHDGRAPLMERLVASGAITSADMDHARAARKGTGRSLGQVLADENLLDGQSLLAFAETSLRGDVQTLFREATGGGSFQEQGVPRGLFDPEERKLRLALPATAFETETDAETESFQEEAREPDAPQPQHVAREESQRTEDEAQAPVDEPESIAEVVAAHEPSESAVRDGLAHGDPSVAESQKDSTPPPREDSSESSGRLSPPFADLTEPRTAEPRVATPRPAYDRRVPEKLSEGPEPVVLLEQQLAQALEGGEIEAALQYARQLAGIHYSLGLHHRAANVFERVARAAPGHWETRRELAQARVACGETEEAVESMSKYARECIARGDDTTARSAYEEVLALDPENEEASGALERPSETHSAPKPHVRTAGLAAAVICSMLLGLGIMVELGARKALREATQIVDETELIEKGRYEEAIATLEQVLGEYPRSLVAVDVRARIQSLEAKRN